MITGHVETGIEPVLEMLYIPNIPQRMDDVQHYVEIKFIIFVCLNV
jgi:hypothetical protein